MPATLTIEVPDYLFQVIQNRSQREGKTPERVATDMLMREIPDPKTDPLMKLFGTIESEVPDAAEHVDEYLGRAIADQMKGDSDA